ncbi:MAG TPA: LysR family transcriptional regulator, partial [Nitrospirae bacterium]|nr:LysR family transcriptional regulator [Nitrospirota bacterium]
MEDHKLKAFCLIVETGGFSRAAKEKFMTQSAMSHLVKNLEDEFGTQFFHRQGSAVIPTPAGRVFYEHAKQILERYKKMEDDIYALIQKVKGTVYIGASQTAAAYLLPQVFYSFTKVHPEVRMELLVSSTEKTIDNLLEGKIDLAIVEGTVKKSSVSLEEIAEDEIVIIASDDNPLSGKSIVTPGDLISQPFIMPEKGSGIREFIEDFLHTSKINPKDIKVSMTLGSTEMIIHMVQAGIGISFASKWTVFEAIKEGSIKLLKISGKKLRRKFYLMNLDKEPST